MLVLDLYRVLSIPDCCILSGQLCRIGFASWVALVHPEPKLALTDGRIAYVIYNPSSFSCVIAKKIGVWDGLLWLPGVSATYLFRPFRLTEPILF